MRYSGGVYKKRRPLRAAPLTAAVRLLRFGAVRSDRFEYLRLAKGEGVCYNCLEKTAAHGTWLCFDAGRAARLCRGQIIALEVLEMSIKDKITTLLFGRSPEEEAAAEETGIQQVLDEPAASGESVFSSVSDEAVLKLPADHPLFLLHSARRREAGYLPMPRLCLDEDGVLPEEVLRREKLRLQSSLRSVCLARLKGAKGGNKDRDTNGRRGSADRRAKEEEQDGRQGLAAYPWFFLSSDKLYAWVLVFPPTEEGEELSREMLYRAMLAQDITYGVNTRLADRLAHDESRYFNLFLLAKGKPAFDGENGNIVDYVPRVIERVLQVDEYDQVDYTALNLIHNVKEGQEICRLVRPTEGEPGRTVLDQEIPAKSGKSVSLPKGRNTEISEDGEALVASIAGHVEFTGRSFQVKPVLDIAENVDFSTGNIKFLGDVNIKGDVLTGFTVRAMGSIWVGGVIEAGSTVEAGGDLTVVKGILGDGTTTVRAHRCVFSKYIENATICVRENLQTDAIINSSIYCDGEVVVRSGRGTVIGGRIWAAKKVTATAVGAKSECRTAITLGGLPCTNFEQELARRELRDLEVELETLECQPESPVKASLLAKLRIKVSTAEMKLRQLEDNLLDIEEGPKKKGERLECGIAFPGTEVNFGEETLRLRHESHNCVIRESDGEIIVI